MPYYLFDVTDDRFDFDTDPLELADDSAARIAAIQFAADMIRDRPDLDWRTEQFQVDVRTADGLALFSVNVAGSDTLA